MNKSFLKKAEKLKSIIEDFDARGKDNIDKDLITGNIFKTLLVGKPLPILTFTCSTINAKYMFSKRKPEYYVSLDPEGNNLEEDLPILKKLYTELKKNTLPVRIIILIGNTDPFYIYSQGAEIFPQIKPKDFFKRFAPRWEKYKVILEKWLSKNAPILEGEVISWYELETNWEKKNKTSFLKLFKDTFANIDSYFLKKDFEWELNKLKKAFGPGKYFDGLKCPPEEILIDWTRRKFAEYAVQGLWIKQIWPESILIQNEKPTDLRYKMYQPLIRKIYNTRLANIYPYGVDNLGFQ